LPTLEIARLVHAAGPQTCIIPINGTRRWYRFEHSNDNMSMEHYIDEIGATYIRLFSMLYEHGIDTIISPAYGDELLTRGEEYVNTSLLYGLPILETTDFINFYKYYDIQFRFYGNYQTALKRPVYAPLLALLERISNITINNSKRRLFFGLFANDATEQVGKLAIDFYLREKRYPDRTEIIRLYYGEYVEPATIYIGFEKPTVFDYTLLSLGNESLYFTVAPTPYLNSQSLRKILYDHLYRRGIKDPEWDQLSDIDLNALRSYYRSEQENVIGIGEIIRGTWIHQGTGKSLESTDRSLDPD
jgi:hypothetical protein